MNDENTTLDQNMDMENMNNLMDFDFLHEAQKAASGCELMIGRTTLNKNTIMGRTLTAIDFDFAISRKRMDDGTYEISVNPETGEPDMYVVIVTAEFPENFIAPGAVGTNIFKNIEAGFRKICEKNKVDYTPAVASMILKKQGGLKFRIDNPKMNSRAHQFIIMGKGDYQV